MYRRLHSYRHAGKGEAAQRGVITLVVSMAILVLSTLVVFGVSDAIQMEQKITNNEARAKQAFEVSEAGMAIAMNYLKNDPDVDSNNAIDPVFDTNANGVGDTNISMIGTGRVVITVTDLGTDMTSMRVSATGFSDDRTATRTITEILVTINPLPRNPENPFTVKSGVTITGSATVHNPEGHSTIWSGGEIDMGSNNSTHSEVPDVSNTTGPNAYPGCMDVPMSCELVEASNRQLKGVDIIEQDTSLGTLSPDDFFANFFGVNPVTYRASTVTIDTTDANLVADADLATHEVIWVEGDADLSGITVGCTVSVTGNNVCAEANTKPSIIIVNGDATFSGTPHIYGLLFVTGNVNISGNSTVHGAVVVGGNATSSTGGSLDIWFNSEILGNTRFAGSTTGSAGTWKDF